MDGFSLDGWGFISPLRVYSGLPSFEEMVLVWILRARLTHDAKLET